MKSLSQTPRTTRTSELGEAVQAFGTLKESIAKLLIDARAAGYVPTEDVSEMLANHDCHLGQDSGCECSKFY